MSQYIFNITKIDEDNIDEWQEIYNLFLSDLEHLYDELYRFTPNYKFDNIKNIKNILYLQTLSSIEGGYMILRNGKLFEVTKNRMSTFNFRNIGDIDRLEIGTTGETLYCKI